MDAFAVKASTEKQVFIGELDAVLPERLKMARAALGLTQSKMAALAGVSVRAYQGYEDGRSTPGGYAFHFLIRAGINANWLLASVGPMFISELSTMARVDMLVAERDELARSLKQALEKAWTAPPPPLAPKINVDALAHAYAVTLQTAPKGETLVQSARKAVAFYQYCWDKGLITEDGEADGNLNGAA